MAARFFPRWSRKKASTAVQGPSTKYEFGGHEEATWNFVFLHDNIHIVSGSQDGTMRKWNYNTGRVVGEPWEGEGGKIYALALSPDGKIIACGRGDGSIQRWTTDGEMIEGVWIGHNDRVRSLSWSPSGSHVASGSYRTILIRNVASGKVAVGPIKAEQNWVCALAYSLSGDRIASSGDNYTICIWNTKTGELVVGPIDSEDMRAYVTSLVWSSDSTKLYSASDIFVRIFDSKTGQLLHRFEHDYFLYSVALSPNNDVLACVGIKGAAQLWDAKSHQSLGQLFHQNHLYYVSFSPDGRYVACSRDNKKRTLWMAKDIVPQLPAPTCLPKCDRRSTQPETRPNSPSSSCLDADATGGGGLIEEAHDNLYNNFFQSSQQSLPMPSSSFSARRLWNAISRHHPLDKSILKERSKRVFFGRRTCSKSSQELATIKLNQPMPEGNVRESGQGDNDDDHGSAHDTLSTRKDKGKERDNLLDNTPSPLSYGRILPAHQDNDKYSRGLWEQLMQARSKKITSGFLHSSTPCENAPQPMSRDAGASRRPVEVAACRDEDRYGIAPESDAEAAAAMLRMNDDVADSSMRQGQSAVVAQVSQGWPTQIQPLTSGPEEIGISCCGFVISCRRSDPHQP